MKFTTVAAFALAQYATGALAFPIAEETTSCRAGPGEEYDVQLSYEKGADVAISCHSSGWGLTQDGCYVPADSSSSAQQCTSTLAARGLGTMADDYPHKSTCGGVDNWNYYKCQCTSFVAWRINKRHGIKFHNKYKGAHWGNANSWDEAAKATNVKVNKTPKVGAVAQSNAGSYGHVAWVSKVSGSKVTIEEYNWATKEGYGTRTVNKGDFNYIHVKA